MCWFDAAWAILIEAPRDALEKTQEAMVRAQARAEPDRETWGLLPEHRRLTQKAMDAGTAPNRVRK